MSNEMQNAEGQRVAQREPEATGGLKAEGGLMR